MNGRSSWPQWPETKLLTISYQLKENFSLAVSGSMVNSPKRLIVSLETGGNDLDKNVVCQLDAKFYDNKLYLSNGPIQNEQGLDDSFSAGDILNGSNFNISFTCRDAYYMDVSASDVLIRQLDLKYSIDTIRYLSLDGHVESINTLSYSFGEGIRGDQIYALPEWPRPKWPHEQSIVFLVPRSLQSNNVIAISGSMISSPTSLTISLVTNQSNINNRNIACQLDANFNEDTLQLKSNIYGDLQDVSNDKSTSANDLLSGSDFKISFICRSGNGGDVFEISSHDSYVDQIGTGHDFGDIRYIVLEGSIELVKTLEFNL